MRHTKFTLHFKKFKIGCLSFLLVMAGCSSEPESLRDVYAYKEGSYEIRTRHLNDAGQPQFVNRLIKQESPYLLQHAHNPVDWWPWSKEAFATAKELDKPILLSIGYSTCHWCHVMERESFEDLEVAEYINANFIAIKVDREEHPDIDEVYLTAVQMLSGQAGWPLTAVLTPDAQPFFGGTYFPRDQFLSLLNRISGTWLANRDAIMEQAGRLETALRKVSESAISSNAIDQNFLASAAQGVINDIRRSEGRPGAAFPREPEMSFLLKHANMSLDNRAAELVSQRLTMLANSGLHDLVGGGFHRYSVDASWKVPHFEKMLYNQAQMGALYSQAYMQLGDPQFAKTAINTFEYVLRDMQDAKGGFYSAMDAESEGREGAFYTWSHAQLERLLTPEELALSQEYLGVSEAGNFQGTNVLVQTKQAKSVPLSENHESLLASALAKLATARGEREPPATDKKIIAAWNASMISALLEGASVFGRTDFHQAAEKAANRLWEQSYNPNLGLARILPSGSNRIHGTLEDYAYLSVALLDLYDHSENPQWLARAQALLKAMVERFYDAASQAFLISDVKSAKELIVSLVTARDDAIVSGNSMAAQALARAYRRTGNPDYRSYARGVLAKFGNQMSTKPQSLSGMLTAASLLNLGEIGAKQYAAKGKVELHSKLQGDQLVLDIAIDDGWHINASEVLQKALIPTRLESVEGHCSELSQPAYPAGKKVTLGFQDDELLVYEGKLTIAANLQTTLSNNCHVVAAQINLQACSNEVCESPERLQIRAAATR